MYIQRHLEEQILNASNYYPVVMVCGQRQVGKSTMLNHIKGPDRRYVTLDDGNARRLAATDPALFFETYGYPLLIDEFQRVPSILLEMKKIVDRRALNGEDNSGMFWLTGSQKFKMMQDVSESLAGRIAVFDMAGLSAAEIEERPGGVFHPDLAEIRRRLQFSRHKDIHQIYEDIFRGATCKVETFGFSPKADLRAENVNLVSKPGYLGVSYHVAGKADFDVEIDIPGKFSVYNSLTAIAVCRHFGVPSEKITEALKTAHVKGRIEMIKVSDDFTLMIDYAHNAMSLESLLTTLKEYEPKRLVCVFGCGGNRSKDRRYEMGEVSGRLADLTIITSDNPRFEEPQEIINDIKVGIAKTDGAYVEICDRKEAIKYAIEHGQSGDVIVLAGKGHEDYQEIKGVKYPMDERTLIAEVLEEIREN